MANYSKTVQAITLMAAALTANGSGSALATEHRAKPVLDVMSLVMKREELAKLLTGNTIVQKGIWPFAIYMRATGTFDGWYAADKKGNEYGPEVVKDSGPWVVKEDQVCWTWHLPDTGGTQTDCRYLVKIGERILIFDEKGELHYWEVMVEEGMKL